MALRRWLLPALLFLAFDLPAHASPEPAIGPSYIGMCSKHWPCDRSLEVFGGRDLKATGWLAVTFGEECPCPRRFLALPGKKFVRVHLANCTCFPERGRRCGRHEPFRGESIASADRKLRGKDPTLLRRYRRNLLNTRRVLGAVDADTQVRLSLCLESEFSGPARRVLLRAARAVFPGAVFVDSVVGRACLPELVCEKHGSRPSLPAGQACIVDTDGDDYRRINPFAYADRYRRCEAVLYWEESFNLISPDGTGFVDPLDRTAVPDFRAIARVLP